MSAIWNYFWAPKVEVSTVRSQLQERRDAVNQFARNIDIRRDHDVETKVENVNEASILLDNVCIALDYSGVLVQDVNKVAPALWDKIENVRSCVRQCLGNANPKFSSEKLIDSLSPQDWQPKLYGLKEGGIVQVKDGSGDITFSGMFKNTSGYSLETSKGKAELGKATETEVPFKIKGLEQNQIIGAKFTFQYNAGYSFWPKMKQATYQVWIKV